VAFLGARGAGTLTRMDVGATPIEVWLEWRDRPRAAVVAPYVRARDGARVDYVVLIERRDATESARIEQSGDTLLQPRLAQSLGEVRIRRALGDRCSVFVRVAPRGEGEPIERRFDCPLVR
jgi:hypothetical protein